MNHKGLKPCPFCEDNDLRIQHTNLWVQVVCNICAAAGPMVIKSPMSMTKTNQKASTKRAIYLWQNRKE